MPSHKTKFCTNELILYLYSVAKKDLHPYHKGKLLILSDRINEARKLILPILRTKKSESWAWELLAKIYPDDTEIQMACLFRALQCNQSNEFLVNIRLQLAQLLAQKGKYSEAKFEVENVYKLKESLKHKIPTDLNNLRSAPWYDATTLIENNKELYKKNAPKAEAIVMDDIPWVNGVVTGHQKPIDDKPGRAFIDYQDGNDFKTIPVKYKQCKWISDSVLGSPVLFKLNQLGDHVTVLDIQKRQAKLWDIFPCKTFSGKFKQVRDTFGFVQDIFISPDLVSKHQIKNEHMLCGEAIFKNKNGKNRWMAVSIESVD